MSKVFRSISISDLMLVDGFAEAYANNDEKKIKTILYVTGLDVSHPFKSVFCTHRNLHNQIVSCERYEGVERQDPSWMRSGNASLENVVNENDFFTEELRAISKQGYSGKWDEQVAAYLAKGGDNG